MKTIKIGSMVLCCEILANGFVRVSCQNNGLTCLLESNGDYRHGDLRLHDAECQTIRLALQPKPQQITKWQLFSMMTGNGEAQIGNVFGIIHAIEREDGSGSSFNVTMTEYRNNGLKVVRKLYVRTID